MAEKDELGEFLDREDSSLYTTYIRDQFMSQGELSHSGLDKILELEQKRMRSTDAANAIGETFSFAADTSVSSAVRHLSSLVAQGQGRVLYCPGAMLDINGVLLALGRECANVDTVVCVSSWEFDALEVAVPSTAEFVKLIPEVLKDSPFVTSVSLQSDTADAMVAEAKDAERCWRLEWRVLLRCVRRGEKKALRFIYYVNEDFTVFHPSELNEPGSLAAIYAPRVHLPLWDAGFADSLRRAGGAAAVVIQDQHAMHCGASEGQFFSPELEAVAAAARRSEELARVQAVTAELVRGLEEAEALGAAHTIVHSLFSDPADLAVQPIRFNLLRAVPLPALQKLSEEAMAGWEAVVGGRLLARVRAEQRSFLAQHWAAVVRADAFARPPASVAAVLLDQLASEDDPEALEGEWPRRGQLKGWGEAEVARLKEAVGELQASQPPPA